MHNMNALNDGVTDLKVKEKRQRQRQMLIKLSPHTSQKQIFKRNDDSDI